MLKKEKEGEIIKDRKKPIYTISPTLINRFVSMRDKMYDNSLEELIKTLRREPFKKTWFFKRGDYFEENTYKNKYNPFYNIVKDCHTQTYISKDIELKDEEFDIRIVGFMDFITKDKKTIYDTKRVQKWNDEKYDNSYQHLFYMWAIPESEEFYYLVGEGLGWNPDNYYQVRYEKPADEELEEISLDIIYQFINWLRDNDYMELYKENFKPRNRGKREIKKEGEDDK